MKPLVWALPNLTGVLIRRGTLAEKQWDKAHTGDPCEHKIRSEPPVYHRKRAQKKPNLPTGLQNWENIFLLFKPPSLWYFVTEALSSVQFSSVTQSCHTLQPHESQHTRPPCPSPTPRVYSNSCPSSQWCHPAISSAVIPSSSCPQSIPASGSFPMSQLFTWGGRSIVVSASASVLPMNTRDWSPLGWTGWISLQSKGLSRVFSNITVQKHQFFSAQLSSQSNSHIHTWALEKP